MGEDTLRDAYGALRTLASMEWDTRPTWNEKAPFDFLARAVQQLNRALGNRPVPTPRIERARVAWRAHLNQRAPVSRADLLALCWDPAIATSDVFCESLATVLPLRSRSVRGLIASYHEAWPKLSPRVHAVVTNALKSVGRSRQPVDLWIDHAAEVVGDRAAVTFARACIANHSSATSALEKFGLSQSSGFARSVVREMATKLAEDPGRLAEIFLVRVFPEDNALFDPVCWGEAFRSLVFSPSIQRGVIDRRRVVDLALHTRKLPDPRMRAAEWQNVPQAAKQQVIQWLSEEDLRFFFDLIMEGQRDEQGRYAFWIRYVAMARRARVVIGQRDHDRLLARLEEIKSRGRSYARLRAHGSGDISASAFIMDFGKVLIVEFSKPNSACYIYSNESETPYLDLSRSGFDWYELKNTRKARRWLSHSGSWEYKFARELASYGIRPQ